MHSALKKATGKRIRLYTASGVESYIGTLTQVDDDYVILRDDRHDEQMFIAIPHIESFHLTEPTRDPATRRRKAS
jgi:hypothetical protein